MPRLEDFMADGTVTAVGHPDSGHRFYFTKDRRALEVKTFDPETKTWTREPAILNGLAKSDKWFVYGRAYGPVEFRYLAPAARHDKEPMEEVDEIVWTCPVTGSSFHMESMGRGEFWFLLQTRTKPGGESNDYHVDLFAGVKGGEPTLAVVPREPELADSEGEE